MMVTTMGLLPASPANQSLGICKQPVSADGGAQQRHPRRPPPAVLPAVHPQAQAGQPWRVARPECPVFGRLHGRPAMSEQVGANHESHDMKSKLGASLTQLPGTPGIPARQTNGARLGARGLSGFRTQSPVPSQDLACRRVGESRGDNLRYAYLRQPFSLTLQGSRISFRSMLTDSAATQKPLATPPR